MNYQADDAYNKSSHDLSNNVCEINTVTDTDNNVRPDLLYNADNNDQPNLLYNLLYDINAIQHDAFVCDINQCYLNNNDCDPDDLLYDVNAVQQHDFVCDNNQYYLNNNDCVSVDHENNVNSIPAITDTIIEVKMNGIFYIPAKKKYILYLLIPKKKRSS